MRNRFIPRIALSAALLGGICAAPAALAAGSSSNMEFTFAPPPITSLAEPGKTAGRLDFMFFEIDTKQTPSNNISGAGMSYVSRSGGQDAGLAWTIRGLGLSDEKNTMSGGSFGFGIAPELYLGSDRATIISLGLNLDIMSMDIKAGTSNATSTTTSTGLQMSLQHHFKLGDMGEFIPYVMATSTTSSTETTVGSTTVSSDASYSTTTMGFDLVFGDVSLGALANTGSKNDMTMIKIGFKF